MASSVCGTARGRESIDRATQSSTPTFWGVSETGGVVLVFGDDHAGKSSTTAHHSELTLARAANGVPIVLLCLLVVLVEWMVSRMFPNWR